MKRKSILLKFGGAAMKDEALAEKLFATVKSLQLANIEITFVHGGGPEIDTLLKRLGIEPQKVDGLRVTDATTMEVAEMVLAGRVNKSLVSLANRQGLRAFGLSAIDGNLAAVSRKDEKLGFVGKVDQVDTRAIRVLQDAGFFPIICSIGAEDSGQHLNINADELAAAIAGALQVDLFVLVTDVPGLMSKYPDPSSVIPELNRSEVADLIQSKVVSSGMIPKVEACCRALSLGAKAGLITDWLNFDIATFLQGSGTVNGTLIR